ncbi:hypothetical protein [Vibrio tritonius]|uniref:hypothetical protein n=1 Tax=Vibrio tritonius TaxID=1435069 RepID=UPI00315DBDDC
MIIQSITLDDTITRSNALKKARSTSPAQYERSFVKTGRLVRYTSEHADYAIAQKLADVIHNQHESNLQSGTYYIVYQSEDMNEDDIILIHVRDWVPVRQTELLLHELPDYVLQSTVFKYAPRLISYEKLAKKTSLELSISDFNADLSSYRLQDTQQAKKKIVRIALLAVLSIAVIIGVVWAISKAYEVYESHIQKPKIVQIKTVRQDNSYEYHRMIANQYLISDLANITESLAITANTLPEGWTIKDVFLSKNAIHAPLIYANGSLSDLLTLKAKDSHGDSLAIDGLNAQFNVYVPPINWGYWYSHKANFDEARIKFIDAVSLFDGRLVSTSKKSSGDTTYEELKVKFKKMSIAEFRTFAHLTQNYPAFINTFTVKIANDKFNEFDIDETIKIVGRTK